MLRRNQGNTIVNQRDEGHALFPAKRPDQQEMILQPPGRAEADQHIAFGEFKLIGARRTAEAFAQRAPISIVAGREVSRGLGEREEIAPADCMPSAGFRVIENDPAKPRPGLVGQRASDDVDLGALNAGGQAVVVEILHEIAAIEDHSRRRSSARLWIVEGTGRVDSGGFLASDRQLRVQRCGAFVARPGPGQLALQFQNVAQMQMRVGESDIEFERTPISGFGARELAALLSAMTELNPNSR